MKKSIKTIFLIFLICGSYGQEFKQKKEVILLRTLFASAPHLLLEIYDLWNFLLRNPNANVKDAIFRSKQNEILGRIDQISKNIIRLEGKINGMLSETMLNILSVLPITIKSELGLDEMGKIIDQIDLAQDEFNSYLKFKQINQASSAMNVTHIRPVLATEDDNISNELRAINDLGEMKKRSTDQMETNTLINFATWATGPGSDSIKTLLGRLHRITISRGKILRSGIFDLLNDRFKVGKH